MKEIICHVSFYLTPFIIGAICHYFDAWVYLPASVVLGMYWLGSIIDISQLDKKAKP